MELTPDEVLAKRRDFQIPCTHHFYASPPHLVRGSMQYLWDSEGRRYLDGFAGVSVVACGHANPRIVRATVAQLKKLQHTTSIYLTQPVVDLAERLTSLLPQGLNRTFFCNSGSEANETAFLLARIATGKRRILSLRRGLHGRTYLGMSATGIDFWRADPHLDPAFVQIPSPFDDRLHRTTPEAEKASLSALASELKSGDVAAMIVEPIQGNGGIIPLSPAFLRGIREATRNASALLIADEVQTGLGRTGGWFGVTESGIVPDLMTLAKALGNGVPIAAVAATEGVSASFTRPSASTLGGNPVSCATALAVLDYLRKEKLPSRAARLGSRLGAGLEDISRRRPGLLGVRGRGLMWGLDIVDARGNPDPARTDRILEKAKDRGLLVGKNGPERNVLALQPPLVITDDDIDFMLDILDTSCR